MCVFYSHYLYSITHPNKYGFPQCDLSDDPEAKFSYDQKLGDKELCIERVMVKLFSHYHCDVLITDRLRASFKSKLTRMGKAIQAVGGTGRAKLLNNWKETKWLLELKGSEIIPTSRKRKPDHLYVQSFQQKYAKLEEKIKEANSKLKDISNDLKSVKNSNKKLVAGTVRSGVTPVPKNHKSWEEYTPQYKRIKKKQFVNDVKAALSFAEDNHFTPTEVSFMNKDTGEMVTVDSDGKTMVKPKEVAERSVVQKNLYIKERYKISNETYHELSMANPSLPSSSSIIREAKKLDKKSSVQPTPGRHLGVQQSVEKRLHKVITHLVKIDSSFTENSIVQVKITGDGTRVSRSMHCVVIAFTIIREVASPNSPSGNHTIAILNASENYDTLAESLAEISGEIQQIQSIKVGTHEFSIEWFFTADLKYLAITNGIESANARFSCIWCKCPSEDRHDVTKVWSVQNEDKGARTIASISKGAALPKTKNTIRKSVVAFDSLYSPLYQ